MRWLVASFLYFSLITSCGFDLYLEPDESRIAKGEPANLDSDDAAPAKKESGTKSKSSSVTYDKHVAPLLKKHCVTCHSQGSQPPALDTLEDAFAHIDASIASVEADRMPPGKPSSDWDKVILKAWRDTDGQEK